MAVTSDALRAYFEAAWGPDTCYPDSSADWDPRKPSREQCGMTALVVQDVLGGDLVLAEVHVAGEKVGYHYWNRLEDGSDLDLTSDQFLPEESVVGGAVVIRPPGAPRLHREQYELLRHRVLSALSADGRAVTPD